MQANGTPIQRARPSTPAQLERARRKLDHAAGQVARHPVLHGHQLAVIASQLADNLLAIRVTRPAHDQLPASHATTPIDVLTVLDAAPHALRDHLTDFAIPRALAALDELHAEGPPEDEA